MFLIAALIFSQTSFASDWKTPLAQAVRAKVAAHQFKDGVIVIFPV